MNSTPIFTEQDARTTLETLDEIQTPGNSGEGTGLSQHQIDLRDRARLALAYWGARRAERIAEAVGA